MSLILDDAICWSIEQSRARKRTSDGSALLEGAEIRVVRATERDCVARYQIQIGLKEPRELQRRNDMTSRCEDDAMMKRGFGPNVRVKRRIRRSGGDRETD